MGTNALSAKRLSREDAFPVPITRLLGWSSCGAFAIFSWKEVVLVSHEHQGADCVRLQISHPRLLTLMLFDGSGEEGVSSATYHVTPSSHSSLDIRVLSPPTGLLGVTPTPVGRRYRQ